MFDSDTVELIKGAPALDGLDLAALPQTITAAYASIVAERIRLRSSAQTLDTPRLSEAVDSSIAQLRRLAFTQEAFVAIAPERQDREAACFVAGTAHHIVLQAERLLSPQGEPSRLTIDAISPEVSATLLFLAADAVADAAEISKEIDTSAAADEVERDVLRSIKFLATGRLGEILRMKEVLPRPSEARTAAEFAATALYLMLGRGIRVLAQRLLDVSVDDDGYLIAERDPVEEFRAVEALCTRHVFGKDWSSTGWPLSLYSGPSHLASLLVAVARHLPDSATATLPMPPTLGPSRRERWGKQMQGFAKRRPYLWRNHRAAVQEGFLEVGTSSVLTFPTGAGKSTMSELKVATALLRDLKVVFLAPTLALVDQTAKSLDAMFPQATVQGERPEQSPFNLAEEILPTITVMTPERCLVMLSFNPQAFDEVGLLVFDECHLLHPRASDRSRRAVDSMLCLLNFTARVPAADLLLISAMISNASALAEWIADLTTRPCLALDLTWKPTRQVRGCVLYRTEDIRTLKKTLQTENASSRKPRPPAELQRRMQAKPYGLFCLHQTWQLRQRDAYLLIGLLDEPILLGTGAAEGNWYLTPNANKVAAEIALGASASSKKNQPLKTLVFAQTIPHAHSIAKEVGKRLTAVPCVLNEQEHNAYLVAVDEIGGAEHLYIQIDEERRLASGCTSHHGLLLPSERQLHESLFRRDDGINVLVATSTLAQGMNLPSQVVIIAGDSRFDRAANQVEKLEAHELLNAAGRAGRAGDNSYGFVLIIPSKVVDFDDDKSKVHKHWLELQSIFAQSDQCLPIEDPLEPLLDRIHNLGESVGEAERYLLRRLPIGIDDADTDGPARVLLLRSMAAFQKRRAGDQSWIEERVASAMALRGLERGSSEKLHWTDNVAAAAGIDVQIVRDLAARLSVNGPPDDADISSWVAWVFEWLESDARLIVDLTRPGALEGLLGTPYKKLEDEGARGRYALTWVARLLSLWMDGYPLTELERTIKGTSDGLGKCEKAREFVLRVIPELTYIFSLPAQIDSASRIYEDDWTDPPASIPSLSTCVKYGLNSVDMLSLHQIREGKLARRKVHEEMQKLLPHYLLSPAQNVAMEAVHSRVRQALKRRG